jgi:uncharacterized membrane protein
MLLELLRLALVTGLLVVLPGFLLVSAVFTPGRLTRLEKAYMSVAGGILLLVLVGVVLGFLPHGQRGFFQTTATGSPNVELVTLALSLVLFSIGLQRGAFPRLARRFPRLAAPDAKWRVRF